MALGELLARFPVAGLTGEGRIGGRLPLIVSPAGIAIADARLAAEAPGRLRQLGPALGPLSSLSDLRFSALELDLERPPGGPAGARLRIVGAHPAFHGGAPLRLELRSEIERGIEGAIQDALAGADAILPGW